MWLSVSKILLSGPTAKKCSDSYIEGELHEGSDEASLVYQCVTGF